MKELTAKIGKAFYYDTANKAVVSRGTLPPGLVLIKGVITGTPELEGEYYFVSDREYKITVDGNKNKND